MSNDPATILIGKLKNDRVVWVTEQGAEVPLPPKQSRRNVELVVEGPVFRALNASNLMEKLLPDTRVFARMQPGDKVACVQLHMRSAIVGMCGDGGNDCAGSKPNASTTHIFQLSHVCLALNSRRVIFVSVNVDPRLTIPVSPPRGTCGCGSV